MTARPGISQERKNQILQAAVQVFSRLGFHQARMDDIAAESGFSKGTLYWYFKSKDEIIAALLASLFINELKGLSELQSAEGLVSTRMLEYTRRTVLDIQRQVLLRPIFYEFYAAAFRQPGVRAALRDILRRYRELVVPLIRQGIQRGEFRSVEPELAALAAGAVLEGALLLWVFDPEMLDLESHVIGCLELFLDGLSIERTIVTEEK